MIREEFVISLWHNATGWTYLIDETPPKPVYKSDPTVARTYTNYGIARTALKLLNKKVGVYRIELIYIQE